MGLVEGTHRLAVDPDHSGDHRGRRRPERFDEFGAAIAFLDIVGTGRPDLVVGTPGDAATRRRGPDAGSVTVMRNVGGRLTYSSILDGTTAGVAGVLEGSSSFGWTLGTGR